MYNDIITKNIIITIILNIINLLKSFAFSRPLNQSLNKRKIIKIGNKQISICSRLRNKPNNKLKAIIRNTNTTVNNSLFLINCFIIHPPSFKITFYLLNAFVFTLICLRNFSIFACCLPFTF